MCAMCILSSSDTLCLFMHVMTLSISQFSSQYSQVSFHPHTLEETNRLLCYVIQQTPALANIALSQGGRERAFLCASQELITNILRNYLLRNA